MVPPHVNREPPLDQEYRPGHGGDGRPRAGSRGLGAHGRVGLFGLAIGLILAFATAGRLTPDPRGFGTHEQLGRPPCALLILTGRPCPTCGLTTALAWFVRGKLARSWAANPAGPAIAVAWLALIPWLLAASLGGRPPLARSAGDLLLGLVAVATGLTVLAWGVRRSLSLI